MKIAITADVHLTSRAKNPERFHALENILDQLADLKIETLFIAGDLFDASSRDPGEFEKLIGNKKYASLSVYILPGNHDPLLSEGTFALDSIHYIARPRLLNFPRAGDFLLLPYESGSSIGEALAAFPDRLAPGGWVLVAHGDYLASTGLRNTYENGLYMPLSARDIQIYQPRKVFLGHIHARMDTDTVHYPGSPCGLDPTETGIRSFLVYDTGSGQVERLPVETDVIFFQETLTVLPLKDEEAYISQVLAQKINAWNLDETQKRKVRARIYAQGYSTNREALLTTIYALLDQHRIPLDQPPDISSVEIAADVMRAEIALAVQQRILQMNPPESPDEPSHDDYSLSAMKQIYGGKA